jgi:hypothetical protein
LSRARAAEKGSDAKKRTGLRKQPVKSHGIVVLLLLAFAAACALCWTFLSLATADVAPTEPVVAPSPPASAPQAAAAARSSSSGEAALKGSHRFFLDRKKAREATKAP